MRGLSRLRSLTDFGRALHRAGREAPNERLERASLERLQRDRLTALVRWAAERSPLYRERYRGLDLRGPVEIGALPTVDKPALMDAFDDWVTDRRLRRADVEAALPDIQAGALHLDEYRVCATGGTSGRRGLFLYSRSEWVQATAAFLRHTALVGTAPRLPRRRIAVVTTVSPLHMSARFGATMDVGLHRVLRLDARRPLGEIVAGLQEFQPDSLNGYPSVLALVAEEQRAGRLRIAPSVIATTSEVRTPEMEARMVAAWGVAPFNVYASTECGVTAVDCPEHRGLHVFEDYVVVENVDAHGRPVPDGQPGERLLVTNLWNRTQPLIRYELSDIVALDAAPCPCGRTLRRIVALDGRGDDVLVLPARGGGTVPVHPLTVRSPFAADEDVRQYQIVFDGRTLVVRLVPQPGTDAAGVAERVRRELATKLAAAGAEPPPIRVELVEALGRDGGPSGKLKLIEVRRPPADGGASSAPGTPADAPRRAVAG
jgi:phenylacetate-coenzyme A ligase PaaK-like adenylate-forming protein